MSHHAKVPGTEPVVHHCLLTIVLAWGQGWCHSYNIVVGGKIINSLEYVMVLYTVWACRCPAFRSNKRSPLSACFHAIYIQKLLNRGILFRSGLYCKLTKTKNWKLWRFVCSYDSVLLWSLQLCCYCQTQVSRDRDRRGILPSLPPVSEREAIRQQYNKTTTEKTSRNS